MLSGTARCMADLASADEFEKHLLWRLANFYNMICPKLQRSHCRRICDTFVAAEEHFVQTDAILNDMLAIGQVIHPSSVQFVKGA